MSSRRQCMAIATFTNDLRLVDAFSHARCFFHGIVSGCIVQPGHWAAETESLSSVLWLKDGRPPLIGICLAHDCNIHLMWKLCLNFNKTIDRNDTIETCSRVLSRLYELWTTMANHITAQTSHLAKLSSHRHFKQKGPVTVDKLFNLSRQSYMVLEVTHYSKHIIQ